MSRIRKTFDFNGTVSRASGLWKRKVVGKPVKGIITVTGSAEDFAVTTGRTFEVGGSITEAPLVEELFPGKELSADGYKYAVRGLTVRETISPKDATVSLMLVIFPWTKMDSINVVASPTNWTHRMLLSGVTVDGNAMIAKTEDVPE